jgi:hypothetical protein
MKVKAVGWIEMLRLAIEYVLKKKKTSSTTIDQHVELSQSCNDSEGVFTQFAKSRHVMHTDTILKIT